MFNILSLDGGGIRGLITATVVDVIERGAFNYTKEIVSELCENGNQPVNLTKNYPKNKTSLS